MVVLFLNVAIAVMITGKQAGVHSNSETRKMSNTFLLKTNVM
jgi:hypothetical protein